jgi:hypothetical protein
MRQLPLRAIAVFGGGLVTASLLVSSAGAQGGSASDNSVPPSFTGGCTASADIAGYGTIDPAASGGVYTVPKSGSASYTGTVPVEGDDRTTSGKVEVALPLGLPSISIKSWGGDNTDGNSDSGTVTWDIPSLVPGNVEMTVSGFHQDEGVRCEGRIKIKLDGSGIGSALGLGAIGLTIVSLAGLAWAMIPRGQGA